MVKTVHRVSELTHHHPSFGKLKNWTALDYYGFLLTDIVLLLLDSAVLENRTMYRMLVYLANAVYYLHYGKQSDAIRAKAQKYIVKFSRWYCKVYDEFGMIPKFHLFQHFGEMLRLHGAACFWDSFNLERFLHVLGKSLTTTVNHMDQASMNFLTRHHCPDLQSKAIRTYTGSTKKVFKRLGYDVQNFALMKCVPLDKRGRGGKKLSRTRVSDNYAKYFKRFLGNVHSRIKLWQVKKMKFRNLALTSRFFPHREAQRVRDCYVCLNEKHFGRIADMCEVDGTDLHLLLLQIYKRPVVVNRGGFQILFPVNNFPVEPTEKYMVFAMNDDLFVQKALWLEHVRVGEKHYQFFALRPNEFFEF